MGPFSSVAEALLYLGIVGLVAVVAVRLGMLLAPRLDRLTHSADEDDGGHDPD
jgi:hypothetical protein